MCQKQLSKGYFKGRGYQNGRTPRFTKEIVNGKRYPTEIEAINAKAALINDIEQNKEAQKNDMTWIDTISKQTFQNLQALENELRTYGHYLGYYGSHKIRPWDSEAEEIKTKFLEQQRANIQRNLNEFTAEYEYFTKKLFVREVPFGLKFNVHAKRKVSFIKNVSNMSCCKCGADVPDIDYLSMAWQMSLCVMCLSEMMPEIQKHINETPEEIKELWSSERFIKDLG